MEEFEFKDEQQEESVKTTLTETDLELDDAEKEASHAGHPRKGGSHSRYR
ncbi:MAG: hypothetical protein SO354_06785 [Collinsella sp.]|nr:hypothetical protein [Collinsella sp.]